jgi:8-oxo-dGTP pyrophosphatase MutT (NUDIX family)
MTRAAPSCHTDGVSVKPPPAAPAATLVLLRDRAGGGVETLLIQRHRGSRFAAGDFVFPGGKLEVDDAPPDAAGWCRGLDAQTAARRLNLGDPRTALGYWIGAIREAFEEVGVLLADRPSGQPLTMDAAPFGAYRRACQGDHRVFWSMVRAEGLSLATDRLIYFAHWVTPEEHSLRFDTRFFVAPMPAGQTAVADDREIVAVRWLAPAEALAAMRSGEISLRLPTIKNLALFEGAASVAEALGRLAGREVAVIRPRLITDAGHLRAVLPGEPGWY